MNDLTPVLGDILVVADNLDDLKVMRSFLHEQGYHIRVASNSHLALTAVKEKAPDLILLDIMMPGMDGYQVCKQLKADPDPHIQSIPLIFISALDEALVKVKAFSAGGVDFITKPVEREELLVRIETHLRLRQAQTALVEKNAQLRQEILERTRTEQALRESEERFRFIFEQAAVGVAQVVSKTGVFARINQRYCDIAGYTVDEMEQITFQEITHPDDLQEELDYMQRLIDGEIREFSMEKRFFHKDGSIVWINLTVSPMWLVGEEPKYQIAIVEDITKRKQVEADLQKSEKQLQIFFDSSPIGHAIIDRGFRYTSVNDVMQKGNGPSRAEHIGKTIREVLPKSAHILEPLFENILATGKPVLNLELSGEISGNPGVLSHFIASYFPIWGTDERPVAIGASVLDVTDRVEAEVERRESENRLSIVFNNTKDLQLLWSVEPDSEFRILAVNRPYIETALTYGIEISEETMIGKTLSEVILTSLGLGQEALDNTLKNYQKSVMTGEPVRYTESIVLEMGTYHSEITLIPVFDLGGRCQYVLYNSHNVTELKKTADALKKLNSELDDRVSARTDDLNKTVQLMAGREVRMAELKKVIKQLRKQMQDAGLKPVADDPLVWNQD